MTLLELLVVVAMIGVLAALTWPTYRGHVLRAYRSEAIESLLSLAAAQERFHLEHGRYADGFEPDVTPGLRGSATSLRERYQLAVSVSESSGYSALATTSEPSGQNLDVRCREFGLDASGRRWARDRNGLDSTEACWR